MTTYIDLQDRTFIIEISNNVHGNTYQIVKFIFTDQQGLEQGLKTLSTQTKSQRLTIEHVKELNTYNRFVKLNDTPQWVLLTISEAIKQARQELTMVTNEMQ